MKSNPLTRKIFLLMFFFSTLIAYGQSKLCIYETSGSSQSFALTEIKKLTFSEAQMNIYRNTGSTTAFFINNIAYMGFISNSNEIDYSIENFSIYPNPAINSLTIENFEIINELKIFDMQGKVRLHLSPKTETVNIDISHLPTGIYFLQIIGNNQVKNSKIIKTH